MKKYIGVLVTIFIFLAGGLIGYGQLQGKVSSTEEKVEELKEDSEKTQEELEEEAKVNIVQTVLLEQIGKTLENLNRKIDGGE